MSATFKMPMEIFSLRYFVVPMPSKMIKFLENIVKLYGLNNWETALSQLVKTGNIIFALPLEVNKSRGLLGPSTKLQLRIWYFLAILYILDLI